MAASQIFNAVFENVTVKGEFCRICISGTESKQKFAGFRYVYIDTDDEKEEAKKNCLGNLTDKTKVNLDSFDEKQHFTQPLAHFTEASLVHTKTYTSKNKGVMHACGHDAHVSCGLAAAKILAKESPDLGGSIRMVMQPAEEFADS